MTLPTVDTADLFEWLPRAAREYPDAAVAVVLPDAEEVGMDAGPWEEWFVDAARLCLEVTTGPTVFLQTDRMRDGRWIDKAFLIAWAAQQVSLPHRDADPVWHKIVLRRGPGKTDLHRPTYSHLVAYGPRPGRRTPDVIDGGTPRWRNGIGPYAAAAIARYLREVGTTVLLNPACGEGTIMEACSRSMRVHGCDLHPARAEAARQNLDPYA